MTLLLLSGQKVVSIPGLASAELTELARAVCRVGVQERSKISRFNLPRFPFIQPVPSVSLSSLSFISHNAWLWSP